MKIHRRALRPDIAFLPIGDRFTMGPDTAAIAAQWLGVKQVVPMHWRHVPAAHRHAGAARSSISPGRGIEVLELKPGETAE